MRREATENAKAADNAGWDKTEGTDDEHGGLSRARLGHMHDVMAGHDERGLRGTHARSNSRASRSMNRPSRHVPSGERQYSRMTPTIRKPTFS